MQLRALMFAFTLVLGIADGADALQAATAAAVNLPLAPLHDEGLAAAGSEAKESGPRYAAVGLSP